MSRCEQRLRDRTKMDTRKQASGEVCFLDLFLRQAELHPSKSAVECGSARLTYQALVARSERLASALGASGVHPGDRVAVVLHRGLDTVVAMVAVLRTGAVYVPIDVTWPDNRIRYILDDLQPGAILCDEENSRRACFTSDDRLLLASSEGTGGSDFRPGPMAPAYFMYTSGSTGRPKGVVLAHGGLASRLHAFSRAYEIQPEDRFLALSSVSFDVSVLDLMLPLVNGCCTFIASDEQRRDPDALRNLFEERALNVAFATPTTMRALVSVGWKGSPRTKILCGGEAIPQSLMNELVARGRLFNVYGPTEATVAVTSPELFAGDSVHLGRALPGVELLVLDEAGAICGPRQPGELVIGGIGVALGYWKNDELTRKKFVDGKYRTGDLVSWGEDGNLYYHGRMDEQVKLHGHRIELLEIEEMARSLGLVRDIKVLIQENAASPRLVAFFIGDEAAAQSLRRRLASELPAYMVPSVWVGVEGFPQTSTGKLDRKALLAKVDERAEGLDSPPEAAPSGGREATLLGIWREVLQRPDLSPDDDFFASGGDSILAMRTLSRAREAGINYRAVHIFQHPTVRSLLETVVQAHEGPRPELPELTTSGLTPVQRWFFEQPLVNRGFWNQSILLRLTRPMELRELREIADCLTRTHQILACEIDEKGMRLGSRDADACCAQVSLTTGSGTSSPEFARIIDDAHRSLRPEEGRLHRLVLIESRGSGEWYLFWTIHHLVIDGVSWRILLSDLGTLLQQKASGDALHLEKAPVSFLHCSERMRALHGKVREAELSYWRKLPEAPLPWSSEVRQEVPEAARTELVLSLSQEATRGLLQDVLAGTGKGINDVLLSALLQAVYDVSGERRLSLWLEGHGREEGLLELDTSRTVGWFTSMFPVYLESPSPEDFQSTLEATRASLGAMPNRGVGYGIVRYLGEDARGEGLRTGNEPRISFNYLGQWDDVASDHFSVVSEPGLDDIAPENKWHREVDINCLVAQGIFKVHLTFVRRLQDKEKLESLLRRFIARLESAIDAYKGAGEFRRKFPLLSIPPEAFARNGIDLQSVQDAYPLTPMQEGMLLRALTVPESGNYIVRTFFDLTGELHPDAWREAWRRELAEQELLRSAFFWEHSPTPFQVVFSHVDLDWRTHDWGHLGPEEQQQAFSKLEKARHAEGFSLSKAPLLRIDFIARGGSDYRLLLSFHHLILDGWSLQVLLERVLKRYGQARGGGEERLTPAFRFRDYVAWNRNHESSDALRFWREHLEGVEEPTLLGDEQGTRHEYAETVLRLEEARWSGLGARCRRQGMTKSSLIQAVWCWVAKSYGRKSHVVYGLTQAGRAAAIGDIENGVGLFITTSPVAVDLDKHSKLSTVGRFIQQVNAQALHHDRLPLSEIQRISGREIGQPLFDCLLVFEQEPIPELAGGVSGGLSVAGTRTYESTEYPLTLSILEKRDGSCDLRFYFNKKNFSEFRVEGLRLLFEEILAAWEREQELELSSLPAFPSRDGALLSRWNATGSDYPAQSLTELFLQQARRTPNHRAVRYGERELSYAELAERTGTLARRLEALGVRPGTPVAVHMHRSLEMVIALHAIVRAGGAYVPIDPEYPAARVRTILEDVAAPVVIFHDAAPLKCQVGGTVLDVTRIVEEGHGGADHRAAEYDPERLMYIIYTSGSTGRPKGVKCRHEGAVNRICWMQRSYPLSSDDVVLQKTPYTFDVSVWEFFWPLAVGASLVVAAPGVHQDASALAALIEREGVTHLHFVPSMLDVFLASKGGARCASLRRVFCSGEALPSPVVKEFFRSVPHAELHNLYGPTEASIDVTAWDCRSDSPVASIPIGYAIQNVRLHVLDEKQAPVPHGVPGELCIAGIALAEGYVNRPEETAKRFVQSSWDARERLYRTGDLARYLPNGAIEYLGRLDQQVKLRGLRIELDEVSSVLLRDARVRQAVVRVVAGPAGQPVLAAYVVAHEGSAGTLEEALKAELERSLPRYMVPEFFFFLEALPVNRNGKLDADALPRPGASSSREWEPPQTEVEKDLAAIWQRVLGVERVGRNDSFFALGGDSILSIRILALAKERGWDVSLGELFRSPRLSDFARTAKAAAHTPVLARSAFSLISARDRAAMPASVVDALPIAALQAGMLFHTKLAEEGVMYRDSFLYVIGGEFNEQAFRQALKELVHRHPMLRTSFELGAYSEPLQRVEREVELPLRLEDWRDSQDQEQRLSAWHESYRPTFDITRAPLFKMEVKLLSGARFALGLCFHHAILDGWSIASMMTELLLDYQRLLTGRGRAIEPLGSGYADYLELEKRVVEDPQQKAFWSTYLNDAQSLRLPVKQEVEHRNRRGTSVHGRFDIPEELVGQLERIARSLEITKRHLFLAAHFRVLAMICGHKDIVSGVVTNGRPETVDAERIVGLFLNAPPMRLTLGGGSWRQLIQAIVEEERNILPHRRYPVSEMKRHCVQADLFDVAFNYVDFHVYSRAGELASVGIQTLKAKEVTNFGLYVTFYQGWPYSNQFTLAYDPDLFDREQVDQFARYYLAALRAMAQSLEGRYELSLLTPEERSALLISGEPPASKPALVEKIWSNARAHPERQALTDGSRSLSYRELASLSDSLARALHQAEVKPGDIVAVNLRRDVHLPVALLGVMRAGATYLPLDNRFPLERQAFMLQDSGAKLVLCDNETRPASGGTARLFNLDEEKWQDHGGERPLPELHAESIAYLIYTSGSTGKPKGVLIRHRNLDNFIASMERSPGFSQGDRLLAVTTVAFDIAALELFLPLSCGGQVVLAPEQVGKDATLLMEWLKRHDITVMQATPATWQQFVDLGWRGKPDLKILVGGEALPPALARGLLTRCRELWNMYGPTETTVWSSCMRIADSTRIRIGQPIADTRLYVLDAYGNPAPRQTVGELYIAGGGVAAGYWRRPDLTRERFQDDPFFGGPMYRTGDLARIDSRNEVECLGRTDHQVKLRGYRIELGEIDAAIQEHPDVSQSAVILRRHSERGDELAGYYTLHDEALSRRANELYGEQVVRWEAVWSETYGRSKENRGALNLAGWNSSYTGQPMPEAEMREWIDETVARIRSLGAKRILEIGCGTGLLLARLAPHCERYTATDFSPAALEYVQSAIVPQLSHLDCEVQLVRATADRLEGVEDGQFDLVILNSVVQYFPSREYLDKVLAAAIRKTRQPGRIFVGDVRHFGLGRAFHASIADYQSKGALAPAALEEKVAQGLRKETELLLSPRYFLSLSSLGVAHAEIELRRGTHHNELTRFRYDAVLSIGQRPEQLETRWYEWETHPLSGDELSTKLKQAGECFGLRAVGNARLARERELLGARSDETQGSAGAGAGLDPEQLYRLAEAHGYRAKTSWASEHAYGAFDVAFIPAGKNATPLFELAQGSARLSNAPLLSQIDVRVGAEIRRALQKNLPEYMVPARLVLLDSMPHTPNGKVDRSRLPDVGRNAVSSEFVEPRNENERKLCQMWQELLGLERVGVRDDFFALGGHSLLATQLITRINKQFECNLSLRALFDFPTIEQLVREIERSRTLQGPAMPKIQRRKKN
uniref:Nonribosomal peptide synthetase subunit 1 n=2 Tax=Bacteria TaxID=2 RepID=A0A4D6P049_9BACT|nr:nonribosomal peptide synthetase subunit 1 [Cystobacter sp. SBCb004]QCE43606.1 nonribosomal peptide synthetase subunit 1 [Expression vector pArg23-V1]QCE43610.1 nonribosomal peptide synthetase subunit 1 [Expression vector pArg235-V1]QCE43615.1 nonribosomal peptide synthetase subunit 1 [Expression vector pArg2345-V2]QCE43621.1 nonribosomal peptide synthetase subunit 1 [Expression vector pArg2345-V1]QCE43627.1 nonribosomal peptide synthetase subunit 1 [Expression vector pArg2345-V1-BsaI]UEN69